MAATATFEYSVRDRAGKIVTGKIEADSQAAVASKLKSMGYAPMKITEQRTGGLKTEIELPKLGSPVKLKELAIFSRQFATMINAGLSMLRALSILEEQQPNKKFAAVIGEMRTAVEAGSALSSSMAEHPRYFPPLMVNMIRAGEVGGILDTILTRLAQYIEKRAKLARQVRGALVYPVGVVIVAALVIGGRCGQLDRAQLARELTPTESRS